MAYRGGFGRPASLLGATAGAIVPASIISGLLGTAFVTMFFMAAAAFSGEFQSASLETLISILVFTGAMIAMGSIGGTFVVAFYLVIFGLPVALLLGERIRSLAGLIVSVATAVAAGMIAIRWMWGFTLASDEPLWQQEALIVFVFVLPAAWFYRRQVIAMRDELPTAA
ncbi:hypothetical protein [Erythrobacter donghaensis]|uniref:hypothetical protein n=1 Tax=Erythrobacter donghaensis TaxID=267135 RepID=UPI000A36B568|nr:hypothetical protein [Erythrobacter donghaensis]